MQRAQLGLTLTELIIALALAATVLTVAVPAWHGFVEQNRITAASNHLMGNLQFARQAAVFHDAIVIACPGESMLGCDNHSHWDRGWIVFLDPDGNGRPDNASQLLRKVEASGELTMHSGGRHRVRFQSNGGAYGSNLTIRICSKNGRAKAQAVVVSNPGRPRVERHLPPSACPV